MRTLGRMRGRCVGAYYDVPVPSPTLVGAGVPDGPPLSVYHRERIFALRGEFLSERSERNQRIAGVRPNRPRAAPSASIGPTPDPVTGVPRPCVERTLQNLIRPTLPVRLRNLVRFTGDTLYPHHDKLQNLFLEQLTDVARRGRPVRAAAESGTAQRGGAARASTTAHNSETQAQKGSGGDVSFPDHSGPGRPGRRGSRVRFCAPDERNTFPVGHPVGSGAEAPEIFWVLLYLYKSTSPGGETFPILRPARKRYCPGGGGGRFPLSGGNVPKGQKG